MFVSTATNLGIRAWLIWPSIPSSDFLEWKVITLGGSSSKTEATEDVDRLVVGARFSLDAISAMTKPEDSSWPHSSNRLLNGTPYPQASYKVGRGLGCEGCLLF